MKKTSFVKVAVSFFAGLWLLAPGCTPGTEWNPNAKLTPMQTTGEQVAQSTIPNMKQGELLLTINPKKLKKPGII